MLLLAGYAHPYHLLTIIFTPAAFVSKVKNGLKTHKNKTFVEYENQDGVMITSSFKKPFTVYDANVIKVGYTIPVMFSNITPNIVIYIGDSTGH